MIEKEITMKFVCKLIELTSCGKIAWMTLPQYFDANDNEPLRKVVIANNQYAYMPFEAKRVYLINEYRSYCATINGGVIILFSKSCGKDVVLDICIQTEPTHYLKNLFVDSEVREKLNELMLQISINIDDSVKFVNDIINL